MKNNVKKKKRLLVCLIAFGMVVAGAFAGCSNDSDMKSAEASDRTNEVSDDATEPKDDAEGNPDIDYLVVVNSNNPVPDDWEESLTLSYTCNSVGDDVYAEATAYRAYLEMKDELKKQDVHVELDSGFRSMAYQQSIVDDFTEKYGAAYAKSYAAVPGCSEHHTGLALDLYLIVDGVTAYENEDLMKYPEVWEKIHALLPDYGFILSYPNNGQGVYEPWHIRYVGKDAAKVITEEGITLEQYVDTISQ